MAASPVTAPIQQMLDTHHEVIAAQAAAINELKAQVATLSTALAAIPQSTGKPNRALKLASEIGCRPNDPAFDNASIIQPLLDKRIGVEFDVGGVYYTSPLKTLPGAAGALVGSFCGHRHKSPSATGLAPFAPEQTHLVEITGVGPIAATSTTPAVPGGAGLGHTVRDLYFLGNAKCDGLRIHGGDAIGVERCIFRECRVGVLLKPSYRVYSPSLARCGIYDCDVGLQIENGDSVCCLSVTAMTVIGGRMGIVQTGWRRGAVFIGVVCEGQSEDKWRLVDARATLLGCYIEGDSGKVGLSLRGSKAAIGDSSIGGYKADGQSQITWLGDNAQAGTVSWGS